MEKEFIPYDLALALKELGFDEPCFGYYDPLLGYYPIMNSDCINPKPSLFNHNISSIVVSAPTFSQAFRFFREKYGDYLLYSFGVIPHFTIIQNLIIEDSKITYEEAELECLKRLIEIVKGK